MFVVVEGLLRVSMPAADGRDVLGDDLHPGSIFGEFSLLTGEPRSATVPRSSTAWSTRSARTTCSRSSRRAPELAQELSRILAERQDRSRALAAGGTEPHPPARPGPGVILDRLRAFFGLSEGA